MIPLLEVDIYFLLLILSFIQLADHCSIPAFEKENTQLNMRALSSLFFKMNCKL